MATRAKSEPFDRITNDEPLYTIEKVVEVGAVVPDSLGEHPPLRVAFMLISDDFAESADGSKDETFEYRISHPGDDGHTIIVTVSDPVYKPRFEGKGDLN